jgi:4-hydroxythreonine-4-phosphate dehydrogenase
MGDPSGIGPEIIRKSLFQLADQANWVIYGHRSLFPDVEARFVEPNEDPPERAALEASAKELRSGTIDAVVTGPVSKGCFQGEFAGQTEFFAARLDIHDFAMMLTGRSFSVVPATTHVALREVSNLLSVESLVRIGRLIHRSVAPITGKGNPRIAYVGLNPHAGDVGLFGDEEQRLIFPAVENLQKEGIIASGPWSPDAIFVRAMQGEFDVLVCGYHDQALIPFKLLHGTEGVNITLGLPRPRTSPDHGPAYDIAGRDIADPTSMIRAIQLAKKLA